MGEGVVLHISDVISETHIKKEKSEENYSTENGNEKQEELKEELPSYGSNPYGHNGSPSLDHIPSSDVASYDHSTSNGAQPYDHIPSNGAPPYDHSTSNGAPPYEHAPSIGAPPYDPYHSNGISPYSSPPFDGMPPYNYPRAAPPHDFPNYGPYPRHRAPPYGPPRQPPPPHGPHHFNGMPPYGFPPAGFPHYEPRPFYGIPPYSSPKDAPPSGVPPHGRPADGVPPQEPPGDSLPPHGRPADGVPPQEPLDDSLPPHGRPADGFPPNVHQNDFVRPSGALDGVPPHEYNHDGVLPNGPPADGVPPYGPPIDRVPRYGIPYGISPYGSYQPHGFAPHGVPPYGPYPPHHSPPNGFPPYGHPPRRSIPPYPHGIPPYNHLSVPNVRGPYPHYPQYPPPPQMHPHPQEHYNSQQWDTQTPHHNENQHMETCPKESSKTEISSNRNENASDNKTDLPKTRKRERSEWESDDETLPPNWKKRSYETNHTLTKSGKATMFEYLSPSNVIYPSRIKMVKHLKEDGRYSQEEINKVEKARVPYKYNRSNTEPSDKAQIIDNSYEPIPSKVIPQGPIPKVTPSSNYSKLTDKPPRNESRFTSDWENDNTLPDGWKKRSYENNNVNSKNGKTTKFQYLSPDQEIIPSRAQVIEYMLRCGTYSEDEISRVKKGKQSGKRNSKKEIVKEEENNRNNLEPYHSYPSNNGVPLGSDAGPNPSYGSPQLGPPHNGSTQFVPPISSPYSVPPYGPPQGAPPHSSPYAVPPYGPPQGAPPHSSPYGVPPSYDNVPPYDLYPSNQPPFGVPPYQPHQWNYPEYSTNHINMRSESGDSDLGSSINTSTDSINENQDPPEEKNNDELLKKLPQLSFTKFQEPCIKVENIPQTEESLNSSIDLNNETDNTLVNTTVTPKENYSQILPFAGLNDFTNYNNSMTNNYDGLVEAEDQKNTSELKMFANEDKGKDKKKSEKLEKRRNKIARSDWQTDDSLPNGWKKRSYQHVWKKNGEIYKVFTKYEYLSPEGKFFNTKITVIEHMKADGRYSEEEIIKVEKSSVLHTKSKTESIDNAQKVANGHETQKRHENSTGVLVQNNLNDFTNSMTHNYDDLVKIEEQKDTLDIKLVTDEKTLTKKKRNKKRNKVSRSDWKADESLPNGWKKRSYENVWKKNGEIHKVFTKYEYLSPDGMVFNTKMAAIEHMEKSSSSYSGKELINLKNGLRKRIERTDWQNEESLPNGWKTRSYENIWNKKGEKVIFLKYEYLSPFEKIFPNKKSVISHMIGLPSLYSVDQILKFRNCHKKSKVLNSQKNYSIECLKEEPINNEEVIEKHNSEKYAMDSDANIIKNNKERTEIYENEKTNLNIPEFYNNEDNAMSHIQDASIESTYDNIEDMKYEMETANDNIHENKISKEVSIEEKISEEVNIEEKFSEEGNMEENIIEEVNFEEKISEEVNIEEKISDDFNIEEKISEDFNMEEKISEEVNMEEKISEEVNMEEKISEEVSIEDNIIEDINKEVTNEDTNSNPHPTIPDFIGPLVSLSVNDFSMLSLLFLGDPNPSPSIIEDISEDNEISPKDIKWTFIKLREKFQSKKGNPIEAKAVLDLTELIRTKYGENTFQF